MVSNQFSCGVFPSLVNCYPNLMSYQPSVNALETLKPLILSNGYTIIQDCNAANPIIPNPSCTMVPQLFDYNYFASMSNNTIPGTEFTVLAEQCKIYYIHYKFDLFGQTHEGYLRHQLGNDSMKLNDYLNTGEWEEFSDFPKLNSLGNYGVIVLKNIHREGYEELALAQREDATEVLDSEITVVDPIGGASYTLRFRNESNKIVIEFIP